MTFDRPSNPERRESLNELDPSLRTRVRALDEPVSWDEWRDVVRRSHAFRPWARIGVVALLASVVLAVTVAVTASGLRSGGSHRTVAPQSAFLTSVELSTGSNTLYLWPSRTGKVCYRWAHAAGDCDRTASDPFWVALGKRAVAGAFSSPRVTPVTIEFTDGTTARPAISWMPAPINGGFFIYDLPAGKTLAGITGGSLTTPIDLAQ